MYGKAIRLAEARYFRPAVTKARLWPSVAGASVPHQRRALGELSRSGRRVTPGGALEGEEQQLSLDFGLCGGVTPLACPRSSARHHLLLLLMRPCLGQPSTSVPKVTATAAARQ